MKNCTKCKENKELDQFGRDLSHKDGRQSHCKICEGKRKQKQYQVNGDKIIEYVKSWNKNNPERVAQHHATYYQTHLVEEAERMRQWNQANSGNKNAINAKRRASKFQATPSWLTKDQLKEIESYYILAKELQWLSQEPLEVDHIVPLQGKNVSGLHVPWNLQILTEKANCKKGNFF